MKGRIGHLDDWVAETPESIAARLDSARSAQGQARRTMGIMSIISMMMLIASYNAYLARALGVRHAAARRSAATSADRQAGTLHSARDQPHRLTHLCCIASIHCTSQLE
ncbi:MAG: hypothetical protein ABW318_14220 [Vicinamibacterales bacterium]